MTTIEIQQHESGTSSVPTARVVVACASRMFRLCCFDRETIVFRICSAILRHCVRHPDFVKTSPAQQHTWGPAMVVHCMPDTAAEPALTIAQPHAGAQYFFIGILLDCATATVAGFGVHHAVDVQRPCAGGCRQNCTMFFVIGTGLCCTFVQLSLRPLPKSRENAQFLASPGRSNRCWRTAGAGVSWLTCVCWPKSLDP